MKGAKILLKQYTAQVISKEMPEAAFGIDTLGNLELV